MVLNSSVLKQSRPLFAHRLRSRYATARGVIIFTGYDYFLQKQDLRRLLGRYAEVILVPQRIDDDHLVNQALNPLLGAHQTIHLVVNPNHDRRYRIIYDLIVRRSKSIRVTTVEEFCRQELRKEYIPETAGNFNINLLAMPNFAWHILLFKRALDISVAGLMLAMTLPLWLLSLYAIRRQSPGPALFRQRRVGLDQTDFECVKFRSMRLDAEALGAQFSRRGDSRTFPYGAFMRATRVDELPQLLNVLKGEISLIGPRPERRVFTDSFEEVIPHYDSRHAVKPGITGYAQIRYGYGAGARDARHKLMYDLYYIKHWSLALELYILWGTARTVLFQRGR